MERICNADGTIFSQSRNLRGIRRHVSNNLIKLVTLTGLNFSGSLTIDFEDGKWFQTNFASLEVLKRIIRNWTNLYGAPLEVNGISCGTVTKDNESLTCIPIDNRTSVRVDRLRILRQVILEHEDRFWYSAWCVKNAPVDQGKPLTDPTLNWNKSYISSDPSILMHTCNSVGCVAGWALATFPGVGEFNTWHSIAHRASKILGLEKGDSDWLFLGTSGYGLNALTLNYATAKDAVDRIDKLIEVYS